MVDVPKEFFTPQSMFTFSGATGATFVVANGIQRAFNFNPSWLALVIAQFIVLCGVTYSTGPSLLNYAVGAVNGFLVFCAAGGVTGVAAAATSPPPPLATPQSASPRRAFLSSWF